MTINIDSVMNNYKSDKNVNVFVDKYKISEEELNFAIANELTGGRVLKKKFEDSNTLEEYNKQVDIEYELAYKNFQSGQWMEALKQGLKATLLLLSPPKNPNLITGTAPTPMSWKDLKSLLKLLNLSKILSTLKKCKSFEAFKSLMTDIVHELKLIKSKQTKTSITPKAVKTQSQLIQEYSNGKNLIDMTEKELVSYYKKLIPNINKEELKCLIDQIHRVKRGEPRYLNTEDERTLLKNINNKFLKNQKKNGINGRLKYNENENKVADIPFKQKELTEFQKNQLNGWYSKGETECLKPIFNDLCTQLEQDVYVYRCVTVRSDGLNISKQCNFLNSIKEGSLINNGDKYTSTAKNINNVLDYSTTFGQSYVLKIKIPKGTKVLDMRHRSSLVAGRKSADEIVIPPCSYKVNKIDYTTGIVDCDFIPNSI